MADEEKPRATGNKPESLLASITLMTALVGIILAAVEALTRFVQVFESHFYLAISVCYAAASLLLWRMKGRRNNPLTRKGFRLAIWGLSTIAYLASVGLTYYEYHFRCTVPAEPPVLQRIPSISPSNFVIVASTSRVVLQRAMRVSASWDNPFGTVECRSRNIYR